VILLIRVVNLLIGWLSMTNSGRLGSLTTRKVSFGSHFILELTTVWHPYPGHIWKKMTIGWTCHPIVICQKKWLL